MESDKKPDERMGDKKEGVVRDPVNWNGQVVSYVKDIGNGDAGYNANVRQVLITLADGSEKVVPEAEILRDRSRDVSVTKEIDRTNAPARELTAEEIKDRDARQKQFDATRTR